ncbi:ketopantoate reductase family protein [Thalassobacillus hwangdonensis]|uniref:2-dehydropantoate 2-reductase n=1 Tax=Thalassobacillus hwangdonensis TaxID=546108 RepID=A0ABW3L471_9BACI
MKIVVIGAGALGAYFGARWEEAGHDVTFYVRERRAAQLKEHGILLHSTQGDYEIKQPRVTTDITSIEKADLVLLAVKGYHLSGTLDQLKHLTNKGAKVLPILNGMEHISILQKELGESAIMGGLSYIIATLDDKGHVVHSSPFHDLVFGALHQSQQAIAEELALACSQANMDGRQSPSILEDLWSKYMFINAFSGITTATDLPIGAVREHPETFHLARMVLEEMKDLANKHGISLTDTHVDKAFGNLENFGYESTSSMHQDRRKGLTLEVEHLHGGALRLGDAVGLAMPYTESIYGMIKPFERA